MDTPYQSTKQVAFALAGTRNGTIVHWPRGITGHGGTRTQFCHVIECVAPTILEAAGIPEPAFVNGVRRVPMGGTSMMYSLNDAEAPERHDLQYLRDVRQPRRLLQGLERGDRAPYSPGMVQAKLRAWTMTSGNCTTVPGTAPGP